MHWRWSVWYVSMCCTDNRCTVYSSYKIRTRNLKTFHFWNSVIHLTLTPPPHRCLFKVLMLLSIGNECNKYTHAHTHAYAHTRIIILILLFWGVWILWWRVPPAGSWKQYSTPFCRPPQDNNETHFNAVEKSRTPINFNSFISCRSQTTVWGRDDIVKFTT